MAENRIVETSFVGGSLTESQYGSPSSGHSSHSVTSPSAQEFSGHTPNRYGFSRPTATNPFPGYFSECMSLYQQNPTYPHSWSGTPDSDQTFNDTLTKILHTQTKMQDVIDKMSSRMTEIENSLKANSSASSSSDEKKRVSPQLSKMVATIHEGLDEEESQFKPNLGSKDEHNQTVKRRIAEEIGMKIGNTFSKIEIDKAIQRYFDSRRRLWRETNNANQLDRVSKQSKSRRHRARKVRLYNRRKKVVHAGSEEARRYEQLTLDCMSEESTESESDDMMVHRPVWRSRTLNMFLEELDKRADTHQKEAKKHVPERRNRSLGSCKDSIPPLGTHKWMINNDWLKEHPDYHVAD